MLSTRCPAFTQGLQGFLAVFLLFEDSALHLSVRSEVESDAGGSSEHAGITGHEFFKRLCPSADLYCNCGTIPQQHMFATNLVANGFTERLNSCCCDKPCGRDLVNPLCFCWPVSPGPDHTQKSPTLPQWSPGPPKTAIANWWDHRGRNHALLASLKWPFLPWMRADMLQEWLLHLLHHHNSSVDLEPWAFLSRTTLSSRLTSLWLICTGWCIATYKDVILERCHAQSWELLFLVPSPTLLFFKALWLAPSGVHCTSCRPSGASAISGYLSVTWQAARIVTLANQEGLYVLEYVPLSEHRSMIRIREGEHVNLAAALWHDTRVLLTITTCQH